MLSLEHNIDAFFPPNWQLQQSRSTQIYFLRNHNGCLGYESLEIQISVTFIKRVK